MKRTCQVIIAISLPLLLWNPVSAEHSGPYVGGYVGGSALMDARSSDSQGDFSLKFKSALHGSAVLGWDFEPGNPVGEGRVELEYTRRSNRLDQVEFVEGSFSGAGNVKADSLLLNFFGAYYDNSRWSPYAGVGIGAARIDAADLKVTGQPLSNSSVVVLAYQLGGGIGFALTEYMNLDLGYRLFSCIRPKFTEANGDEFKMDYISHSAVLGLRVGF